MGTVRLLDLPGVAEIEEGLSDPGRQLDPRWDDLEDRIEALSSKLFGITEADTEYRVRPGDQEATPWASTDACWTDLGLSRLDEWEKNFEFLQWEWEEEGQFWGAVGLDVTDAEGERALIMSYLGRQLVCVIKGLHPEARLTLDLTGDNSEEARLRAWEAAVTQQAEEFKRVRGK